MGAAPRAIWPSRQAFDKELVTICDSWRVRPDARRRVMSAGRETDSSSHKDGSVSEASAGACCERDTSERS
mgnify:CR=1 FL=1|jgi:hypothetical protein